VVIVHGWPDLFGPLWVVGSSFCVYQLVL